MFGMVFWYRISEWGPRWGGGADPIFLLHTFLNFTFLGHWEVALGLPWKKKLSANLAITEMFCFLSF